MFTRKANLVSPDTLTHDVLEPQTATVVSLIGVVIFSCSLGRRTLCSADTLTHDVLEPQTATVVSLIGVAREPRSSAWFLRQPRRRRAHGMGPVRLLKEV